MRHGYFLKANVFDRVQTKRLLVEIIL